ncbi:MAG TPA: class I SAM-dependent methyltransferase [Syntrophales bacterium]|nr:class I SAM-dependent methyltransferase [Syntrophales bacterium]
MTQLTSGWRSLLSLPKVYNLGVGLLGSKKANYEIVYGYIKPKLKMRILDIGCGPASILKYLPQYVEYYGIDIDQRYIDAAREKYGDRAYFYCMPLESIYNKELSGFDLVMGLGVLHHLDDVNASAFFSFAAAAINDRGDALQLIHAKSGTSTSLLGG